MSIFFIITHTVLGVNQNFLRYWRNDVCKAYYPYAISDPSQTRKWCVARCKTIYIVTYFIYNYSLDTVLNRMSIACFKNRVTFFYHIHAFLEPNAVSQITL